MYVRKIKKIDKPPHIISRHQWWLAQCECGTMVEKPSNEIRRSNYCSKSCQARAAQVTKELNILAKINKSSEVYKRYKICRYSANVRNHEFSLTFQDFREITSKPCMYCGELNKKYTGIDRVDNAEGYTQSNSAPCCEQCNRMKLDYSLEEFLSKCQKIVNNLKSHLT